VVLEEKKQEAKASKLKSESQDLAPRSKKEPEEEKSRLSEVVSELLNEAHTPKTSHTPLSRHEHKNIQLGLSSN